MTKPRNIRKNAVTLEASAGEETTLGATAPARWPARRRGPAASSA
jgi:hypothetical protein